MNLSFKMFVYLIVRMRGRKKQRERKRDLLFFRCSHMKSLDSIRGSYMAGRTLTIWTIILCVPRHKFGELGQKWSSWNFRWSSWGAHKHEDVTGGCHRWWLSPQCHSTCTSEFLHSLGAPLGMCTFYCIINPFIFPSILIAKAGPKFNVCILNFKSWVGIQ